MTSTTALQQCLALLRALPEDQQRIVNRTAYDLLNEHRDRRNREALRNFRVGDEAIFWGKTRGWVRITITKINPTTVKGVQMVRGIPMQWRVSPSILRKVEEAQAKPQGPSVADFDFGGDEETPAPATLMIGHEK